MKRVQRRRLKGWRMPENTIYCGRGSKWGNPFKLYQDMIYVDVGYRRKILDKWICYSYGHKYTIDDVVKLFRDLLMDTNSHEIEPQIRDKFILMRDRIKDLKGKNLSCWCKEGEKCHVDVLLELANS